MSEGLIFYRCSVCHRVVSVWDIKEKHGCRYCGNHRLNPSSLTLKEKLIQICKHPKIWEWKNV
jgi:DNA-directed RNA polymerase subunit RPC12/RpoP